MFPVEEPDSMANVIAPKIGEVPGPDSIVYVKGHMETHTVVKKRADSRQAVCKRSHIFN